MTKTMWQEMDVTQPVNLKLGGPAVGVHLFVQRLAAMGYLKQENSVMTLTPTLGMGVMHPVKQKPIGFAVELPLCARNVGMECKIPMKDVMMPTQPMGMDVQMYAKSKSEQCLQQ